MSLSALRATLNAIEIVEINDTARLVKHVADCRQHIANLDDALARLADALNEKSAALLGDAPDAMKMAAE